MKRSPMKPSQKPMKRSPMRTLVKPSARANGSVKTLKVWTGLKTSRPKMTPIRKSARNEECTIRLPMGVCNYDIATTVLAHSNELADGKGMGLKAPDECAAYSCSACHDVVDRRRPPPEGMNWELVMACFKAGIEQTRRILLRKGLME
jgi:hypothetical protein